MINNNQITNPTWAHGLRLTERHSPKFGPEVVVREEVGFRGSFRLYGPRGRLIRSRVRTNVKITTENNRKRYNNTCTIIMSVLTLGLTECSRKQMYAIHKLRSYVQCQLFITSFRAWGRTNAKSHALRTA